MLPVSMNMVQFYPYMKYNVLTNMIWYNGLIMGLWSPVQLTSSLVAVPLHVHEASSKQPLSEDAFQ